MALGIVPVSHGKTASRDAGLHVIVDRASKTFETQTQSVEALREISLGVAEHEVVTLIGPSGCGKSTLLRLIGGLIEPTSGRIELRGQSPQDAQRAKDIGFVFQQPALLPWRNVAANVELLLELNKGAGATRLGSTDELLALVGLSAFAKAHRTSCPAACSSAYRSRALSSSTPRSCSWTSPSALLTRSRARACGTSCSGSGAPPRRRSSS